MNRLLRTNKQDLLITILIIFIFLAYFIYHTIIGKRGLLAYLDLTTELEYKRVLVNDLIQERKALEQKAKLLDHKNLDVDMLDELARKISGLIAPDEQCLTLKHNFH